MPFQFFICLLNKFPISIHVYVIFRFSAMVLSFTVWNEYFSQAEKITKNFISFHSLCSVFNGHTFSQNCYVHFSREFQRVVFEMKDCMCVCVWECVAFLFENGPWILNTNTQKIFYYAQILQHVLKTYTIPLLRAQKLTVFSLKYLWNFFGLESFERREMKKKYEKKNEFTQFGTKNGVPTFADDKNRDCVKFYYQHSLSECGEWITTKRWKEKTISSLTDKMQIQIFGSKYGTIYINRLWLHIRSSLKIERLLDIHFKLNGRLHDLEK